MSLIDDVLRDPAFQRLKSVVIGATGLAYYMDKDAAFAERIARRQDKRNFTGLSDYLAVLLKDGPAGPEFQALINELAVGETFFFRYAEQFEALRAVAIPECLRRNQASRTLRIWSAGCSIGPEAYTLEILLKQHFAAELEGWQVSIVGTDINGAFIEHAKRAAYGDWAMRGLSPETLSACFDREKDQWVVKPQYRTWTSFFQFNLVEGPLPSYTRGLGALDIVLCRNVMIYFDEAARVRLLQGLHDTLVNGGWLVVGHAETGQQMTPLYTPVPVPGATLYRKPEPAAQPAPPPAAVPDELPTLPPPARPRPTPEARRVPRREEPRSEESRAEAAPAAKTPPPGADLPDSLDRASALEACLARIEGDRLNPALHFQLGLLEEELGVGDAVAAFRRALYLDPGFALADYQLALAYWRRGKLTAAQRHFRNALDSVNGMDGDALVAEGGGLTVTELRSMIELWLSGEEG
ncbi:CheR family methyltransferase [Azospirillum sp. SYSU D00513]|uniref:CheR family methyltransferase n=1 Tax=Azospirillum sp. SYSU D00513 TaxID=2812561 RepID=UPI001A96F96D|nr:CheR family methyltransferase [Azospirillum sp. SYSU D00513]